MSNIKLKLGKRIRQLRLVNEMTQEQLAEAADISISFLGGIERGLENPTIETLEKLSIALNVSVSEIINFNYVSNAVINERSVELHCLLIEYTEKINKLYEK